MRVLILNVALIAIVAACAEDNGQGTQSVDAATLTYHADIAPIIQAECTSCHSPDNIGPFDLTSLANVQQYSAAIEQSIRSGSMPPIPAKDTNCQELDDERIMNTADKRKVLDWIDAGMPAGDPATASALVEDEAQDFLVTQEVDMGIEYAGAPDGDGFDEFRCFVIDPEWTDIKHLRGFGLKPGTRSVVHHITLYLQLPEQKSAVDALVEADEGPGYNCPSGPGFGQNFPIAGYAPGAKNRSFPNGATISLPPGVRFVIQLHYNFAYDTAPDNSSVLFWEVDEPSDIRPRGLTAINRDFYIPAGASHHQVQSFSYIVTKEEEEEIPDMARPIFEREGKIWGASGHMHNRGKAIRLDLIRNDGTEDCLLDIPEWDFNWQGSYRFKEPVQANAGDQLRITCTWDNSAENQPIINGEPLAPRDLQWGDGSFDEMCLGSVRMTD